MLGNFLVPLMIGAKDLAFPKLILLSWYIYMVGGLMGVVRAADGRPRYRLDDVRAVEHEVRDDEGRPGRAGHLRDRLLVDPHGPQLHRHDPSDAGARHDVVQDAALPVGDLRDEPHQRSGTPVIAITSLLIAAERLFNFGFFDPARGGDPVLFQHLFWFYSHPAVYIMVLPAMG